MEIEIVNWRKFNYRTDVNNPTWFRLDYKIIEDPEFFDLTHEEFKAWIYLLCMACKKNSERIRVIFTHAKSVSKLSEKGLKNAIKKLQSLGHVHVHVTPTPACVRYKTEQYNTEQDRTEQNKTEDSSERSQNSRVGTATALIEFKNIFEERFVPIALQETWLAAYPDIEWIRTEIFKALAWEQSNPTRKKKKFAPFISRWLAKAWDWRKTTHSGSRTDTTNWSEIFSKSKATT